jgi:hypothetical protein
VPWQSLTADETPSDVDVKICNELDDGKYECIRYQEVWEVIVVTKTHTSTQSFAFTATVTDPGTLFVATLQAVVTDTVETIDLSATLLLETEIETESSNTAKESASGSDGSIEDAASTLFITKTVEHVPRLVV